MFSTALHAGHYIRAMTMSDVQMRISGPAARRRGWAVRSSGAARREAGLSASPVLFAAARIGLATLVSVSALFAAVACMRPARMAAFPLP